MKFYEGAETAAVSQVGSDITGWGAITSGATTADFLVGDLSLTSSTKNYTLPGWMDDARVYSGAATQSELEAVRQEGLVPEPASAVLLLLGLPLVIGRRRRR